MSIRNQTRQEQTRALITQAIIAAQFPRKSQFLFRPKRYKILRGGRGSAKSWSVARALLIKGVEKPRRILCAREFQNSLAESVHQLLSEQVLALGLAGFYKIQENRIIGSRIGGRCTEFIFAGLRTNVTKIKSFESVDIAWVEEGQSVGKKSWDILCPTIRRPGSEIWVTLNPDVEEDEVYQRFIIAPPDDCTVVQMNWSDNPWFPAELRAEKDHLKARDLDAYLNIWEGQCRLQIANPLWHKEIFGPNREPAPLNEDEHAKLLARMRRIVVAVDPSGCEGEKDKRSDKIGLVVCGIGHDNIGRILHNASGRYSPAEWGAKAIQLYDTWKADLIVAERNFGGAAVEILIRAIRRTAPVKLVNASRGKSQRAAPVASLYERGLVRHIGFQAELERQYCLFSTAGWTGPRSPDDADAAIWGLTELMLDPDPTPNIRLISMN